MKTIANTLASVIIIVLTSGCTTETSVLFRSSSDKTPPSLEILFISPFLALTKNNHDYSIGSAHWLNDPELANTTGDVFDKWLVNSVGLIGQSKSKGLLFGQGHNPNPENWHDTISVNPTNGLPESQKPYDSETGYFIITFDRVLFFGTENEMNNYLREIWNISAIKLEPVDVFFEKAKRSDHQPDFSQRFYK